MNKSKTCKYNVNRYSKIALPFCTWGKNEMIIMPPHIYHTRSGMNEKTCSRCKCYTPDKDE